MNLQDLRNFLCESGKGQVFDSLLCVELGLEEYGAFWQAHQDMNPGETFEEHVVGFICEVHEFIGFDGDEIEKVVEAAQ